MGPQLLIPLPKSFSSNIEDFTESMVLNGLNVLDYPAVTGEENFELYDNEQRNIDLEDYNDSTAPTMEMIYEQ